MSNKNDHRVPLNNLTSMRNLGNTPSTGNGQCRQNLRFIFQENENPRNRERLRRGFGNQAILKKDGTPFFQHYNANGLTPFRVAFNAGDPNLANVRNMNSAPDSSLLHRGSNQINLPMNPGVGDGISSVNNGSYYSGNPRFVYDGSDFTRYKKLAAINRNYKDITFGGDLHNASQHAYRRVQ